MFVILLLTIIGFLVGLTYVMIKRKIKPGSILAATFLSLLFAGVWKVLKGYLKIKGRRRYF